MDLGLRRACADGTPGHEVGSVLGADGIEEFAASGEAELCDVDEEGASDAETFVDLEATVHVGVVDEPLPADSGAGLFEVDTHDNVEVATGFVGVCLELVGIFEGGFDIVHRAWSEPDESHISSVESIVRTQRLQPNDRHGHEGSLPLHVDL